MPRGKELNEYMRTETLAKIDKAALHVFAEFGYHAATMRQIARVAGFSYGLVYHYYPSKAKLFCRLVDYALNGSLEAMRFFMSSSGSAWQRIQSYSAMIIKELFEGETSYYFVMVLQAITQGRTVPGLLEHVTKILETYYEVFTPVIEEAQQSGEVEPGDPAGLAAAFFSFVQGLSTLSFQPISFKNKISSNILLNVLCSKGIRT